MGGFKDKGFGDRLSTAAAAKKSQLERFREKPAMDEAAFAEQQAARLAVRVARDERAAERKAARDAAEAKEAAEKLAQETLRAQEAAEKLAGETRDASEKIASDKALLAEQKAARDARYAARKARK